VNTGIHEENQAMSARSKKIRDKRPPSQRAGFKLNMREAYSAVARINGEIRYIGFIDETQGVYQGAGEFKEICYEPTGMISLPLDFFQNCVRKKLQHWEMRDDMENVAYRITFERAQEEGKEYATVMGVRWGVHHAYFTQIDEHDLVLNADAAPERDQAL
jgi:hypothetical protein